MNAMVEAKGGMTPAQRRTQLLEKAKARRAKGEVPQAHSGSVFAKIDGNTGKFTVGRDKTEVLADTKFAIIIEGCTHGWQYWESAKIIRKLMVFVIDAGRPTPPSDEAKKGDLPKPKERDGWAETVSLKLWGMSGELEGIDIGLDNSNQSSISAADGLLADIFDQMGTPDGDKGLFNPVVTIAVGSYENKTYSRDIFFPIFNIVGWTDGTETVDAAGLADDGGLLD